MYSPLIPYHPSAIFNLILAGSSFQTMLVTSITFGPPPSITKPVTSPSSKSDTSFPEQVHYPMLWVLCVEQIDHSSLPPQLRFLAPSKQRSVSFSPDRLILMHYYPWIISLNLMGPGVRSLVSLGVYLSTSLLLLQVQSTIRIAEKLFEPPRLDMPLRARVLISNCHAVILEEFILYS